MEFVTFLLSQRLDDYEKINNKTIFFCFYNKHQQFFLERTNDYEYIYIRNGERTRITSLIYRHVNFVGKNIILVTQHNYKKALITILSDKKLLNMILIILKKAFSLI